MMYYHRRPPERRTREYLMPFFILLLLALIVVMGWRLVNRWFFSESSPSALERAFLTIEQGSVEAQAIDNQEWKNIPDKIYLYRGEKLRTGAGSRATLTFFNEDLVRLDENSEMLLTEMQEEKGAEEIALKLVQGSAWAEVLKKEDPDAFFKVETDLLSVTTRNGVLALQAPGTVYMIEGGGQVNVQEKTYTLGVGQEFLIDQEGVDALEIGEEKEVIFALSDAFKASDFYQWNQVKRGARMAEEVNQPIVSDETALELEKEEKVVTSPQITEPGKNGEKITLSEPQAVIKGALSTSTQAVIVNDYKLQLFKPGDSTFSYTANVTYGNLKAGENEYKVYAQDRNGDLSEPALITLILPQEVFDAAEKEPQEEASATPVGSSESGGVRITEPNSGENFSTTETEFDIKGVVPAITAKVVVNDYELSRFREGDTIWTYKAYKSLGSLSIGQKNTYTVKAFDAEGDLLGQDSITIDVESEGAPEITIPTPRSSYLTTLNELVLGGTVGKWVQQVYVNDQKLLNYIPGSEKWHHTVTLQPGKNSFRVHGESNGVKTASDEIEITYQP